MNQCNETSEVYHHGIRGMRWGIRRYQNKDGTLTPAGKKRADKMKEEYTQLTGKRLIRKPTPKTTTSTNQNPEKKRVKDMSDTELKDRITRLENEKKLAGLQADTATKGQKFVSAIGKQVIAPAATEAGKRLLTDLLMKVGKQTLGLDGNAGDAADEVFKQLKRESESMNYKYNIDQKKKYFEKEANKRKEAEEAKKASEAKKANEAKKEEPKAEKAKIEYIGKRNNSDFTTFKKGNDTVINDPEWRDVSVDSPALLPYIEKGKMYEKRWRN